MATGAPRFAEIFGTNLQRGVGENASTLTTAEALAGKIVMAYCSASWCGPCRQFTPRLKEAYSDMKSSGKDVEVVFVSMDRTAADFAEYFTKMPWLAIPYDSATRSTLPGMFGVRGIPTLLVFDADGNLTTDKGVQSLMADPRGSNLPWRPRTVPEILADGPLLGKTGPVEASALAGKSVGLYFSAHWCPPCRGFTPKLVAAYNAAKAAGRADIEIVFVSGDRENAQFEEYYGEMPWLTLPFQDPRIGELNGALEVEGIPMLVILDAEGKVVTKSGRGGVEADPRLERWPYPPLPVEDLSKTAESFGYSINDKPSIVVLCENADDSAQADVLEALTPLAEEFAKTPEVPEVLFFTCTAPAPLGDRVRTILKLKAVRQAEDPEVVLLNLPQAAFFKAGEMEEVTTDAIRGIITRFKAGELNMASLR